MVTLAQEHGGKWTAMVRLENMFLHFTLDTVDDVRQLHLWMHQTCTPP